MLKVKTAKNLRMPQEIQKTHTKRSSLVKKASEYTGSVAWQKYEKFRMWGSQKGGTERAGMREEKKIVVDSWRKNRRQDISHRTLFHGDGYQSRFTPIVRIKMPIFI